MAWGFGDRRGSTAVMFAVVVTGLLVLAGMAIDYGRAIRARTLIQASADNAALTYLSDLEIRSRTEDAARQSAEQVFRGPLGGKEFGAVVIDDLSTATDAAGRFATVRYSVVYELAFGGLLGRPSVTISGRAVARIGNGGTGGSTAVDVVVALDASDSLGLAATEADRQTMRAGYHNCEFACHRPEDSVDGGALNPLEVARSLGVRLRIDVARDAFGRLAEDVDKVSGSRLGLYAFHSGIVPIHALTDDIAAVRAAAAAVTLGTGSTGDTQTDFAAVLPALDKVVPTPTPERDRSLLILVTDGVNSHKPATSGPDYGPIDPDLCRAIKARGVLVGVVYTRYLEFYDSYDAFANFVAPFYGDIEPKLRGCASPGLFAVGDTPSEIESAVLKVYGEASRMPFLSN